MFNKRLALVLCSLVSFGAVGIALISQYIFGMQPCAWCTFQRLIYLAIGLTCLLGAISTSEICRRFAAILAAIMALGGVVSAWYQYSVASAAVSCDRTFADKFMVGSGLDANVPWLFGVFATCMDARVEVLGVEYALWSLALFGILTISLQIIAFKQKASQD